jgi:hypothetical protein
MVLYKHGVGFFVRQGSTADSEVILTFKGDEINDILKSLAVFDQNGGQVLGLHYQTPMDKAARLADSSIRLSEQASLRDLLRDLRGRRAELSFESTPGTTEVLVGRIIGIDDMDRSEKREEDLAIALTLLSDEGRVRVFRLSDLRAIRIDDPQSGHDLGYFLDTSMSEDTRRNVAVRLSEGEHQLVVYYVAPSPTWRVSYRIVAESDTEKAGASGKALMQGWGLFDNRLDEDLEDVKVTLVAGQPISFIYELYASRIPQRPTVQDETRVAPGPIEYETAKELPDWLGGNTEDLAFASMQSIAPAPRMFGAAPAAPAPKVTRQTAAQAAPAQATAKDTGEFFQYEVSTPVSVKRGESALVPIIGADVAYGRELLYNGGKLPTHPVAALRFKNTTGLTLERGPVTIVEDGDYKGEAVVPFTKTEGEIYLPYAVELGVKVTERYETSNITTGLSVENSYLVYEDYQVFKTTYVVENTTTKAQTVTIEAPILTGHELFETKTPDVETATDRRWRVSMPAQTRTEFVRQERHRIRRSEQLRSLKYQQLNEFLAKRWLDRVTLDHLSDVLDRLGFVERSRAETKSLTDERKDLYEKQNQLLANINALSPTGQEAGLRNRILAQLDASHQRLEAIETRINELARQISDADAQVETIIHNLNK